MGGKREIRASSAVARVGLVVLTLALNSRVSAQGAETAASEEPNTYDEEARALYQAGRVAFDDGRFEDALGYFERAHELSGRPQLLYNIASAADRLRQNAVALEHFEAYLEALPDADNRRSVEARIALLRDALEQGQEHGTGQEGPTPEEREGPTPEEREVPTPEQTAALAMDGAGGESQEAPPAPSRTGLWVGVGVGAAALVGLAVVLALVLRDPDPNYQPSDEGILVFALESP